MPRPRPKSPAKKARARQLGEQIGQRIRSLREQKGMTLEGLAFEADLSKGHLFALERGTSVPTVVALDLIADALEVLALDLINDPAEGDRQRLLEQSRLLAPGPLRKLVRDSAAASPKPRRKVTAN